MSDGINDTEVWGGYDGPVKPVPSGIQDERERELRRWADQGGSVGSGDLHDALSLLDAERKRVQDRDETIRGWLKENNPGGWIDDLRKGVQELEGALRFYKETADLFGYEFGVYEASLCEATQVKTYKCSGCDAEGESHWPDWVVTFVHKDHCRFVKAESLLPKEQTK